MLSWLPPRRELSAVRLTGGSFSAGECTAVAGGYILHHSLREWSPSFCGRRQGGINATGMNANLGGAYPQSAYRKGGVFNLRLNTPVAKATSLFRKRNSEPLTASSAEGAFWGVPPRKASPERGGARHRRAEGYVPPRRRDHSQAARNRTHLSGGTK